MYSCSYQLNCFQCPSDQWYDLEASRCVSSCPTTLLPVQSSQFNDLKICKSATIYVDPSSSSVLELGTKKHPYKNLVLAFIEMFNLHSHTERTVNIYVKESTESIILLGYMYAVDIKVVNLLSYSDTGLSPRQATIIVKENNVNLFSVKTRFNIMKTATLLNPSETQSVNLTAKERSDLVARNRGFVINRCDFTLSGFILKTAYASEAVSTILIKSIYQQSKTIRILNTSFEAAGTLLRTTYPLNLRVENVYIDYYKATKGFEILSECDYPSASVSNVIVFSNVTAVETRLRTVSITNSLISIAGAANFTLERSRLEVYATQNDPYPPVQVNTISTCNPADSLTQIIVIQGNTFKFIQSDENNRFSQVYISTGAQKRKMTINLDNNTYENIVMSTRPVNELYLNNHTSVYSSNLRLENATFQHSVIYISQAQLVSLSAYSFKNISRFERALVQLSGVEGLLINDITVEQCAYDTMTLAYYIDHSSSIGYANITNLKFKNIDLLKRTPIYLSAVPSLKLLDSNFDSVIVHENDALIQTGILSELEVRNVNFTKVTSKIPGDNTNVMLDISGVDISKTTGVAISRVVVTASEVSFMILDRVASSAIAGKTFTLTDFEYKDSTFKGKNSLLGLNKLEVDADFTVSFANVKFSNIRFPVRGNLLMFGQHLRNQVRVTNLEVKDTSNAYVYLEAFNPQNTAFPVKVLITNLTTTNVFSGFASFINAYEGAKLEIRNSILNNIYTFGEGAVAYAGYQNAEIKIYDSTVEKNSAIEGGAFKVESNSLIELHNCQINSNFALLSAVVKSQNNGRFIIVNSSLAQNSAQAGLISQLFDNPEMSIIRNCTITANAQYNKDMILSYLSDSSSCGKI